MVLVIAIYRCEVDGTASDSVDVQVRHFTDRPSAEIEAQLRAEPVVSYSNDAAQKVSWPLAQIAAIEHVDLASPREGEEVIGFIASAESFVELSRQGT